MRRPVLIVFLFIAALVAFIIYMTTWSPPPSDDDQGTALEKDGSVETAISVQHADSTHDVILTSHKVWIKNNEYATITHRDTIPTLDSTNTTAENSNGDTRQVKLKKDYQIFITVK